MVAHTNATEFSTPDDTDIVMSRVFDAPASLIYECSTRPEHIVNWWGPRAYKTEVAHMDVRPGGSYRFIHRGADGTGYVFSGVYIDLSPTRIVQTQVFEGAVDAPPAERLHQEMLVTTTLEETNGRTRLTSTCRLGSREERDGLLASGMMDGASESFDRLGELLATLV